MISSAVLAPIFQTSKRAQVTNELLFLKSISAVNAFFLAHLPYWVMLASSDLCCWLETQKSVRCEYLSFIRKWMTSGQLEVDPQISVQTCTCYAFREDMLQYQRVAGGVGNEGCNDLKLIQLLVWTKIASTDRSSAVYLRSVCVLTQLVA